MVDDAPKTIASAQASGSLHRRAKCRRFAGAVEIGPVATATASCTSSTTVGGIGDEQFRLHRLTRSRAVLQQKRHPGHQRDARDDAPHAQRHPPAQRVGHRHRDQRRQEGRHRHGGRVDGHHDPESIGEVLLDQWRQQHVARADPREHHGRRREQGRRIHGEAAQEQPQSHQRDRDDGHPLQTESALEQRREQTEDREAHRRRGADQADDDRRDREVRGDMIDHRG